MKPIELTEEHKSKLLEMCKVLFPDYKFYFYHPLLKTNMLVGFLRTNDSDTYDNCDIFIHWFEFCMGTLAAKIDDMYFTHNKEKLESKNDNIRITAWDRRPYHDLWSGFNFGALKPKSHPVDYLYQEFLKLK